MNAHIAVDIGGTQMRAASYGLKTLEPIKINRIPSNIPGVRPRQRLIQVIESVWPSDLQVLSVGIAVAGPLDHGAGIIQKSPNIPDFDNFPIVNYLENHLKTPIFLGNDANLAALGEWKYGAGQRHQDLIYFTVSTGIGSGVITGGQLLLGARGMAAELGHVTVFPGGPICSCGKSGHLEAFSSGTSIAKWVAKEIDNGRASTLNIDSPIDAKSISEAARHGDSLSLSAFERAGRTLGLAIANFLHIFNPTLVIFGGGVSKSIDLLLPHINTSLESEVFAPGYLDDLELTSAALGDDSGLLGALVLARESH